jgi:hypothetical protein
VLADQRLAEAGVDAPGGDRAQLADQVAAAQRLVVDDEAPDRPAPSAPVNNPPRNTATTGAPS